MPDLACGVEICVQDRIHILQSLYLSHPYCISRLQPRIPLAGAHFTRLSPPEHILGLLARDLGREQQNLGSDPRATFRDRDKRRSTSAFQAVTSELNRERRLNTNLLDFYLSNFNAWIVDERPIRKNADFV